MGQKIEYDIVEHCNLNCRNCGHFSQFKDKQEKSLKEIGDEISLLCSKLDIDHFRICGGEPLLHSNIVSVLTILRKLLGNSCKIVLLTNGIKLNSMSALFFLTIKALDIKLEISEYPIGINFDKIEKNLQLLEIPFTISDKIQFYNFIDSEGKQDGAESLRLCRKEFYCPFYDGGYIYLCAYVKNVPFANQKFGYKIEHDRISILESQETIDKYLNSPCPTCRFCKSTRQPEPWIKQS